MPPLDSGPFDNNRRPFDDDRRPFDDDRRHFDEDRELRRLFFEIDHRITNLNTKRISSATGNVSRGQLVALCSTIAGLRAAYIEKVRSLTDYATNPERLSDTVNDIRTTREAYDEALEGFNALRHAVARGYITVIE